MEIIHQPSLFLGIDVGKESLVACLYRSEDSIIKNRSFKNTEAGVAELVSWLNLGDRSCRAVLEATSKYHRLCERCLLKAGIRVDLLNPRRARALALGLGISDKDDKVDAKVLAQAAKMLQIQSQKIASIAAQDLKDHSRSIDTIKREAAKFMKRMEGLDPDSDAYKSCQAAAKALKEVAVNQEKVWRKAVKLAPETQRRYQLALTVDDVGHVTARVASVELPFDMDLSQRKLVAYSGLVPRRHQSGNQEMPPQIYGGNAWLRTGVFMAAMHSVYFGKRHMPWYQILLTRSNVLVRTKGGRHMKAITAVMRKILCNIIAVIKRNSPWTKEPPTHSKAKKIPHSKCETLDNS